MVHFMLVRWRKDVTNRLNAKHLTSEKRSFLICISNPRKAAGLEIQINKNRFALLPTYSKDRVTCTRDSIP